MYRATSIDEFRSASFCWRFAYLLLWLAGTAIIGLAHPQFVILVNLLILPWFCMAWMRNLPFDQIGAAIASTVATTILGPALLGLAYHPAIGTVSKPAVIGTMAAIILAAMAAGFALGRWVARAPTT